MALNIKDADTDRLARELAAETGETITTALRTAVAERLARVRRQHHVSARPDLHRYIDRARARTVLDGRDADEILGYDENGLPR
ncbi:type II toxin-antitoxin system VapB family antitoxin [Acidipropionibacterium virtanenii]|uniref:Antitoxin VapB n=1 Tax=Acidipropionibacterium virtanenii TaxID=2057246 RepID=A0A344URQ5_9ACTN|nr:type II toxin-antitoxin system VapB family antitoxin [Acidipropionibacterium virtanenii]AXE37953.1 Antitoxin VapB [Acidipropionibacterium virtanenii]